MTLPKKITPCPIIDAIIEIRFIPDIHPSAVFGLIVKALDINTSKVENLPILQIPEPLRKMDPNLSFKPHYKIADDDYIIQVGPDVIAISCFPTYIGWELFSKKINDVFDKIEKAAFINSLMRVGIRYINFFELDIFEKINLNISISGKIIDYKGTVLRTEIVKENFVSALQVANNVANSNKIGSIIDIDLSVSSSLENFFKEKMSIIDKGHQFEKELFFSLLEENFLKSLNPEY